MLKLKDCPFCGGQAKLESTPDEANFIECSSCGAATNLQWSLKDDAIPLLVNRWNRRESIGKIGVWQQTCPCRCDACGVLMEYYKDERE